MNGTHSASGYRSGCRCEQCRRAHSDRMREGGYVRAHQRREFAKRSFVAGRWIAPVPDEQHGSVSTYTNRGCRCVRCTVALREYQREYRRSRAAS